MQTTIVGQVTSSVVAVASISDQNGIILVDINPSPYSNSSTVKALQPQLQKAGPGTGDGKVIVPGIAVTSVNNSDGVMIDYYTQYTGNGSIAAGWPQIDKWISFVDMFNNNYYIMEDSCKQFRMGRNSKEEIDDLYNAIQAVAQATFVDHRFILAVVLQESGGCVRAPTSNYGVPNPGIMQDHNGTASCNSNGFVQDPCPKNVITQMILEGAGGTTWGDGLAQCINSAGTHDVSAFYRAARIYNSGSIDKSDKLEKGIATHCYASDIANRLTGWVKYPRNCTLDV